MRTILVKRHCCDHCRKRVFSKPAMERHEPACIKNPDRVIKTLGLCGVTPTTDHSRAKEAWAWLHHTCPKDTIMQDAHAHMRTTWGEDIMDRIHDWLNDPAEIEREARVMAKAWGFNFTSPIPPVQCG